MSASSTRARQHIRDEVDFKHPRFAAYPKPRASQHIRDGVGFKHSRFAAYPRQCRLQAPALRGISETRLASSTRASQHIRDGVGFKHPRFAAYPRRGRLHAPALRSISVTGSASCTRASQHIRDGVGFMHPHFTAYPRLGRLHASALRSISETGSASCTRASQHIRDGMTSIHEAFSKKGNGPYCTLFNVKVVSHGEEVAVCTVKVCDEDVAIKVITLEADSQRAKVTLWRESETSDVRPGDFMTITDVVTLNHYKGKPSLSTTNRSTLKMEEVKCRDNWRSSCDCVQVITDCGHNIPQLVGKDTGFRRYFTSARTLVTRARDTVPANDRVAALNEDYLARRWDNIAIPEGFNCNVIIVEDRPLLIFGTVLHVVIAEEQAAYQALQNSSHTVSFSCRGSTPGAFPGVGGQGDWTDCLTQNHYIDSAAGGEPCISGEGDCASARPDWGAPEPASGDRLVGHLQARLDAFQERPHGVSVGIQVNLPREVLMNVPLGPTQEASMDRSSLLSDSVGSPEEAESVYFDARGHISGGSLDDSGEAWATALDLSRGVQSPSVDLSVEHQRETGSAGVGPGERQPSADVPPACSARLDLQASRRRRSMAEGSTGGAEGRRGTIGKRRRCDEDEDDSALACSEGQGQVTEEAAHDLKESPCPVMPHQCLFKNCKTIPLRPSAIQQCSSSTHPTPINPAKPSTTPASKPSTTPASKPSTTPPIQPPNLPTLPTMQPPCQKPLLQKSNKFTVLMTSHNHGHARIDENKTHGDISTN
ncbi:hypothetical protein MAR_035470 [Mya arenaria]|uniref:Uncharacterized protein n=1 Tax=Mya arenaria TaxID=6604 RepID=A0ABY7EMR5_MYAAR|nr:hypothetical protein MAR_035470 [Mya arenaria]